MTKLDAEELREKSEEELQQQLTDLQRELVEERGQIEVGGFAENPGQIAEMKKSIARIKTVLNEKRSN
ncbi:MAG: 50S ribosomal protein L29 [Candidatus Nanosalina sp.]